MSIPTYDARPYFHTVTHVTKLAGESNFSAWKDDVETAFMVDGGTAWGIISGTTTRPDAAADAAKYDQYNRGIITMLWLTMQQSIVDEVRNNGHKTASECFTFLKTKYEKSSWARRVALRTALHKVEHDPKSSISLYIESLSKLRRQLKDIGEDVGDAYFKDILLTNLHPTYHSIRTSLLTTAAGEPSLSTVTAVLIEASPAVNFDSEASAGDILVNSQIKSEPVEVILAACERAGRGKRKPQGGSGRCAVGGGGAGGNVKGRNRSRSSGSDDSEDGCSVNGRTWGSMSNEGCHRCGILGHKAPWCIADMPHDVKRWCLNRKEKSNYALDAAQYLDHAVVNDAETIEVTLMAMGIDTPQEQLIGTRTYT
ncbi:hypothetical protein MPER_13232 [Moniliophthora perniciosa FA553]|nr:hypothetical protein MPER_13232 [Moniliophthora perniciosa FA553]